MRRVWSRTLLTTAAALSLRPRGTTKRPATPAVREKELNLPPFDLGANLSETLDEAAARADGAVRDRLGAMGIEDVSGDWATRVLDLGRRATRLGARETAALVDLKLRETEAAMREIEEGVKDGLAPLAPLQYRVEDDAAKALDLSIEIEGVDELTEAVSAAAGARATVPTMTSRRRFRRFRAAARTTAIWRTAVGFAFRVARNRRKFSDAQGPEAVAARSKLAADFRDALLRLGPTFIKFGQLLSTRVDVLPPEVIKELATLQNEVPSFSPDRAITIVKEELGVKDIYDVFETFEREPLAAASLAQVHRATLKENGDEVVVKVQRDGLREQFDVDCANIKFLARLADRFDPENEGVASDWKGIADTSETVLYREIDFLVERDAAVKFREAFEGKNGQKAMDYVKVPRTYDPYCTSKLLVLEYVPGTKINDVEGLQQLDGVELPTLSRRLTFSYLEQLCRHGFFHCDPHPGNVAVDDQVPGGRLIYYDFGMMETIERDVKAGCVDLVYSLYKNEPIIACDALETMGVLRPGLDRFSIERIAKNYLDSFCATVESKNAKGVTGIDDGAAKWETEMTEEEQKAARKARRAQIGKDLFATQAERPFVFPPKFTFVFRALSTIDGIGKSLDGGYDLSRLSQPYLRELADLRDGSRYATAFSELLSKVGWRPKDVKQVVMAPRTLASADKSIKRIEAGDLRLRVRSVELETQLQNVETRQRLFGAAAVAVLLAQTSLGGVAATYEGAARVWRLVLSRGCGVGAAWASLEAFGAYCLLRKADQNKKRFANQLNDC